MANDTYEMEIPGRDADEGLAEADARAEALRAELAAQIAAVSAPPATRKPEPQATSEPMPTGGALRVTASQESLSRVLAIVGRAAKPKGQVPAMANVLLATENGRLRASCTDISTTITAWMAALVEAPGATTVEHGFFSRIIDDLGPVSLDIGVDDAGMSVVGGRSQNRFSVIPAESFPQVRRLGDIDGHRFSIPASEMKTVALRVAPFAAHEQSRPVLGAVSLWQDGGSRVWAACDGIRVAEMVGGPGGIGMPSLLIPADAFRTVAAIAASDDVDVVVSAKGDRVGFGFTDVEVVLLALEGPYPSYRQFMARETHTTTLTVDADVLARAVRIAGRYTREAKGLPVIIEAEGRTMHVSGRGQTRSGVFNVDCEIVGEPLRTGYDAVFLSDAVASFAGQRITLQCSYETVHGRPVEAPTYLRNVDPADTYIHVIQPLWLGAKAAQ